MQAIEHDGHKRMVERYEERKMEILLNDPKVKEVRVFRLRKGMRINVQGTLYKVTADRPNGKVTLKPV